MSIVIDTVTSAIENQWMAGHERIIPLQFAKPEYFESGEVQSRHVPLPPGLLLEQVKRFASKRGWQGPLSDLAEERSYELLELSDNLEVWAIHWPRGGHLQLHDHGGSAGAFWVVSGCLKESYIRKNRWSETLGHRRHQATSGVGFGADYIHDVGNDGDEPAISIHAYSPPMPAMTYYNLVGDTLIAEQTEYRADPSWAP